MSANQSVERALAEVLARRYEERNIGRGAFAWEKSEGLDFWSQIISQSERDKWLADARAVLASGPVASLLAAARAEGEQDGAVWALGQVREICTHNDTPVNTDGLRWAAAHEALCRSWIFDVLTGLADVLARADAEEGRDRD